jgi:hypothetical protein
MPKKCRFPDDVLLALDRGMIIGIRAGQEPHRFIGLWVVVVEGGVFVRSWGRKRGGWHHTLLKDPHGTVQAAGREFEVRAVQTRSERLKEAVDRAYLAKYKTPAAMKYTRDLVRAKCRATTTELVPLEKKKTRRPT